jgi:signal transduction histidine kinase
MSASAFTTHDLSKLKAYGEAVGKSFTNSFQSSGAGRVLSHHEMLDLTRAIAVGELSVAIAKGSQGPLGTIRRKLQKIDRDLAADSPLREEFDAIDRASRRIEETMKGMAELSRSRAPVIENCDIGELISDAIRLMQPYFHQNLVDPQVRVESDVPNLRLDRWQIIQAMANILRNAADAMANAPRRILAITAKREDQRISIAVSDTGPGIAASELPHVFDPFFTTKAERGTGLGLYMAKRVIEDHRGDIRVQSQDCGTTFIISLPL